MQVVVRDSFASRHNARATDAAYACAQARVAQYVQTLLPHGEAP
jgi:hypothetical protein